MNKIFAQKSLIIYLFFLFPFFLISGPFLPDFLISGFALFVLFYLSKNQFNYRSNVFYFFLIFYTYININSFFFSDIKLVSLATTLPYIRFIFFSLFLGIALSKIKELKKIIFYSFFSAYLILLIDSCFQLISGFNLLGYPYSQRMSSLFGDELIMGSFVVRTLPVVLAISYTEKFNNKFFLQLLILIIAGILVYFSSERTSAVYFLLILFSYLIFNLKNTKFFLSIILLFTLLFGSLYFIKKDSVDRLVTHTISQFNNYGSGSVSSKNFLSYRHVLHYSTAIDLFNDRKLLGHGVKSFRYLCGKEKYSQLSKIIEDNMIYSPIDGFFFLVKVKKTEKQYIFIQSESSFFPNVVPNVSSFKTKNKSIFFLKNIQGHVVTVKKKHGDRIKKGDPLIAMYGYTNGCNTHPHNLHLQFLAELGLIGYTFILFAFLFLVHKMFLIIISYCKSNKTNNHDAAAFFILLGLFSSLFPFFPSGNFFGNWLSAVFFLKVSFLINIMKSKIYK